MRPLPQLILSLLVLGLFCNSPVRAQGIAGDVKAIVGYSNFIDESELHHFVIGGATRLYITRRLAVEPEFLYMRRSSRDQDIVFQPNIVWEFRDRDRKVVPYVIGGAGLLRHWERYPWGNFTSNSWTATAGIGVRIAITKNLSFSPEFRMGWEPFVRATGAIGYSFR